MRSLFLVSILVLASACSATADRTEGSSADLNASNRTPVNSLVPDLKAAYEHNPNGAAILTNAHDGSGRSLTGAAREAFDEYANTSSMGLRADVGGPVVQVGTFEGVDITYVAGDLSDTGSEYGFYDSKGNALALAYTGQGEHPGPGGVDWEDTKPTPAPTPVPTPTPVPNTLTAQIKAAYEANQSDAILAGVHAIPFTDLPGKARENFDMYAQIAKDEYGNNNPGADATAEVGTFQGQTIYYVAGILSDTGNEAGFYDASGNIIAVAYSGQGEQDGPGGVDWE